MTNVRDVIIDLKKVKSEKGYSYSNILTIMEEKGIYPVSKSTLSKVFKKGSEEKSFKYEEVIKPLADALLDIETVEADDDTDTQAMKSLLQYKHNYIAELKKQIKEKDDKILKLTASLDEEKLKRMEKVNEERERGQKSIDFLKDQILLKDRRYDSLLSTIKQKDELYDQLLKQYLTCPYKKQFENGESK